MTSPGRATDSRSLTGIGTTNTSATITGPTASFRKADIGRPITGTGIPAAATVAAVASATSATLSANATATGTITAQLGAVPNANNQYGFTGWSPETDAEASTQQVTAAGGAGVNDPSRMTDSVTQVQQRNR